MEKTFTFAYLSLQPFRGGSITMAVSSPFHPSPPSSADFLTVSKMFSALPVMKEHFSSAPFSFAFANAWDTESLDISIPTTFSKGLWQETAKSPEPQYASTRYRVGLSEIGDGVASCWETYEVKRGRIELLFWKNAPAGNLNFRFPNTSVTIFLLSVSNDFSPVSSFVVSRTSSEAPLLYLAIFLENRRYSFIQPWSFISICRRKHENHVTYVWTCSLTFLIPSFTDFVTIGHSSTSSTFLRPSIKNPILTVQGIVLLSAWERLTHVLA